MNPLVANQLLTGAKKVFSNKYVIITLVVVIIFFIAKGGIKKVIRTVRENKFNKNETKDTNQLALQYRTASNPSGNNWMIDWDGTNEEAIEKLAYQTKGVLDEVADAYKLKFDETLSDRMSKELDSEELQNWRNIVT